MVNQIICGDAYTVLKEIPEKSVHLIVTSPPYNVGMNYGVSDELNYKHYLEYIEKVLKECYRVLITGGKIAINLPSSILKSKASKVAYLSIDYILLMRKIGFLDREWIGWIKMPRGELLTKSTSWGSWRSPSNCYLRDAMEYIIVMDKEQHKRTDKKGQNDITRDEFLLYTSNCWYIAPETNRKNHPAPFPEELPYRLIKLYTWEDDIVLDPFCGSGTTCVVAKKLGRNYIGIDINPKFVEYSIKRINSIPKQLPFEKNG